MLDKSKLYMVLSFINRYADENGFPPTVRDICGELGIKSTATAYDYVNRLKEMGLLQKADRKKRAVVLKNAGNVRIPLLGTVTAGQPILATENCEGYYSLPSSDFSGDDLFMLRVKGDSMIEAGIFDGDKIIVRKQESADDGDIVVAEIESNKNAAEDAKNKAIEEANKAAASATQAEASKQGALAAQTAAEAARDLANTYKNTADTHRQNAQKAQTAAETARNQAQTAQGAAEDARDAAIAAKEAAENISEGLGDPLGRDEAAETYATKTELTTGLAGKANTSHTHTTAQVTGLDTALAGKSAIGQQKPKPVCSPLCPVLEGRFYVVRANGLPRRHNKTL